MINPEQHSTPANELVKDIPAFFFLGPPGSGKGTQSKLIQERLGFLHISSGEILRQAIARGEPDALAVQDLINRGDLVSDELIASMVRDKMRNLLYETPHARGVIFDGFPRTVSQAKMMDRLLNGLPLHFVGMINLQVPESALIDRLRQRVTDGERRADDQEDVIRQRLYVWREKTHPLEEFYRKNGSLFMIDGLGDEEEVFQRLYPILLEYSTTKSGA